MKIVVLIQACVDLIYQAEGNASLVSRKLRSGSRSFRRRAPAEKCLLHGMQGLSMNLRSDGLLPFAGNRYSQSLLRLYN